MTASKSLRNITASVLLALSPVVYSGGGGIGRATEVTQIANNVELAAILASEVKQYAEHLKMVNDMVKNTRQLSGGQWKNVLDDIRAVGDAIKQGQALAYSLGNLDELYAQRYPDYAALQQSRSYSNFGELSRSWTETNRDTTRSAMRMIGLQGAQLDSESAALDQILSLSKSSQGRMQVLQAGNLLAGQMVGQVQKLRQLQMASIQQQATFQSTQEGLRTLNEAWKRHFYGSDNETGTVQNNGKRY